MNDENLALRSDWRASFEWIAEQLRLKRTRDLLSRLVIYEMTDGMRTSTAMTGAEAYVDGGLFVLRLIQHLAGLGSRAIYVNVIEQRHRQRENYQDIYQGLARLVPMYDDLASRIPVRYRFVGQIDETLAPVRTDIHLWDDLRELQSKTRDREGLAAYFLINYSLDWAYGQPRLFAGLPAINVIVRHAKLQVPTGMQLPPAISDLSSLVYAQQGSSSKNWTDFQLLCLIGIAARSAQVNEGTQYLKTYSREERDSIRTLREEDAFMKSLKLVRNTLGPAGGRKRAIIASPFGPEVYEF